MSQPEPVSQPASLQKSGEHSGQAKSKWPLVLAVAVYAVFFAFLLVTAISVGF